MKLTKLLIPTLIVGFAHGQIQPTQLRQADLPKSLTYVGKVVNAVKWADGTATNYVIATETGNVQSKTNREEGYNDAALYAYHYAIKNNSTQLVWKLYDFNKECPLDLNLHFIDKTLTITDLDKNGVAEVWLMYKNACQGDVSPEPTKIIMYEIGKKYALRGESTVKLSETEFLGGNFTMDTNFKIGPVVFRQHAEQMWKQNNNPN